MDIVRLYKDYGVQFSSEGNKHAREGWVQVHCPFCAGRQNYHLGWNIEDEYFHCYRCGWKPPVKTIASLLNVTYKEARGILQMYDVNRTTVKKVHKNKAQLTLPTHLNPLGAVHRAYLKNRGFNGFAIAQKWGLQATGAFSKVEGTPYKHRIWIPYYWNGQLVTYDTRDFTDTAEDRYKACPKHMEVMERKKILYGNQEAWEGGVGICVEGPTDVWRFGDYAFAVSGTAFTQVQVRKIAQIFHKVWIVFDNEPTAQKQARRLQAELQLRGVDARIAILPNGNDPGGMQQKQADEFVNKLLKTQ